MRGIRWILERSLLLALLVVAATRVSTAITWRPVHDQVLMMYVAFANEAFGKLPYRDIFEMNPPGTHLLHLLVFELVGRSELGLRLVDMAWLFATCAATVAYLRPFGIRVGLSAACLFTIDYIGLGPLHAFQREYLCVLPVALSLWLAFRGPGSVSLRMFGVGVLYGAIVTIKPFLAIGALPVALALVHATWTRAGPNSIARTSAVGRVALWGIAGGSIPILGCILHLYATDSLVPFWRIVREYWPLYGQLRGDGSVRGSWLDPDLLSGVWSVLRAGPMLVMLPFGAYALASGPRDPSRRVERLTLYGTIVAFVGYIAAAGKFWEYHGLPVFYAGALISGFAEWRNPARGRQSTTWLCVRGALLISLLCLGLAESSSQQAARVWHDRVLRGATGVASFLERHAAEGELVQPLDVASGAVHAMLLTGAKLPTSFLYDFHFYHHTSTPFIASLRAQFLQEMKTSQPRFVIAATQPSFRARGRDSEPFTELDQLLAREYVRVYRNSGLEVLERRAAGR